MPVKSIPIRLDKQRRLCFDFNAFAELQRECKIGILDLQKFVSFVEAAGKMKTGLLIPVYELRGFIWAGLLDETPDITLKEVGKILDDCFDEHADEIGRAVGLALKESTYFKSAEKKTVRSKTVKKRTGVKRTT